MRHFYGLILSLLLVSGLSAQTGSLTGQIADESGAVVPGAKVTLNGPEGVVKSATSNNKGAYSFSGLAIGNYTVQAAAPDLAMQPVKVTVKLGAQTLNLQLKVASTVQQVTVQESAAPVLSTEASSNVSALVLRGEDLQALSDDPEDLAADLQALAGPSAGPNGGSIFIDGFSGGELPPKDSIREIRINQNPFAPEYDRIGFGRIEIFTKPGTDKFRGSLFYNIANDALNSRNPYAAEKAPLHLNEFGGNVSGPLGKRMSFTLDAQRHMVDNGSIVNAVTLDPQTLVSNPFTDVRLTPQRRLMVSPRLDYQIDDKNTLVIRYAATKMDIQDAGIGSFDLVSRGYHVENVNQTVQATETAVVGATVNETRFQYFRSASQQIANSATPALSVLGSFNDGGAQVGHSYDTANSFELQNYTTVIKGAHSWKFGVRMRGQTDSNISPSNFGGTFTFAGGLAPVLDANNQPIAGQTVQITSIERYRRTLLFEQLGYAPMQVQTLGGGPTQFSINAGNPALALHQMDVGVFAGDDWKLRPNLTLSLGLRYETQTNLSDQADFAPRIGFAWAPGGGTNSKPKTVLRGGFGMFYDRFALGNTLTADRYNGVVEQQYVVTNPLFFPNIPSIAAIASSQSPQVIQKIESRLRAPYLMQSALTVERQLPASTTLALTYTNTRGLHVLRSEDLNAPLPGTYNPTVTGSGVYPYGSPNPAFLMTSSGVYNQNQLMANVNSRVNANISLFGFYMLNQALSNSDGLGTFPANPYNYSGEYGPASNDIRQHAFIGGSINTKWNLRLSPYVTLSTGVPFNITTGRDIYGTTLFNARPGIASDPAKPGVIQTPYGLLDSNPSPGEALLPRNYGRGPGQYTVNMRLAKTFGFGPEKTGGSGATQSGGMGGGPGGGGHGGGMGGGMGGMFSPPATNLRYNLTISLSARNLLNHNNPGPIIGNITSPLFGQANSMAGGGGGFSENANNRRLEWQMRFTF